MKLHSPLWLSSIEDHYRRRADRAERLHYWLSAVAIGVGLAVLYWLATLP